MEKVTEVLSTNDYSLFKTIKGNRAINKNHLQRLKVSMFEKQLVVPIIVNKSFEIIDGQHRFEVCKDLSLPIYFIQNEEYGMREVQMINSNFSTWKTDDYINAYALEGKEDYIRLAEFRKTYGIQPRECILLLGGKGGTSRYVKALEFGLFKITQWDSAVEKAQMLFDLRTHYVGYNRRSFVVAMVRCFENPGYDHEHFLHQLEKQTGVIRDCTNSKSYLQLIEQVYNHGLHEKNKVRFY